jgi:hypothetical protein
MRYNTAQVNLLSLGASVSSFNALVLTRDGEDDGGAGEDDGGAGTL